MSTLNLRIGTRASQLAQWQANWVGDQLRRLGATVKLVEITTCGDTEQSGPVAEIGVQGAFTKEIQTALLESRVDVAVHSLKDLPTAPIEGLVLAAVPLRENVADALVARGGSLFTSLPQAARVGTGSLRRRSQLKHLRPDLQVVGIRGNVDTRLRKLDDGEYDAVILAAAGLSRLGLGSRITELLQPPIMLPAPGQGALGIECREDATAARELVSELNHSDSRYAVEAERSMLALLHGGCSAPIGAWGRMENGRLALDGLVGDMNGTHILRASASGSAEAAMDIGRNVAEQLLDLGAAGIIASARAG